MKWLEFILTPAAITGLVIIIGVYVFIKKAWPFVSSLVVFFRKVMGHEANPLLGEARQPGLFEQLNEFKTSLDDMHTKQDGQSKELGLMKDDIAKIKYETTPNHGGSMKDSTKRLETNLRKMADKLEINLEDE
jgi:hypothetical protein